MVLQALCLLAGAVKPLLVLPEYMHPCADDYTYGLLTHKAWITTHSLWDVFVAAFEQVKESYSSWQGTHTSIFLMALSPAVFEDSVFYGVATYFLLFTLIVSNIILVVVVFKKLFGIDVSRAFYIALITVFWMIESMYSPVNGLFWYNGAIHYIFMHSCMLFAICACILYLCSVKEKRKTFLKVIFLFLTTVFAYICGGGNYSTALLTGCILGLLLFAEIIMYRSAYILIPFLVYAASFFASIKAPGNTVRASAFEGATPIEAIIEAFKLAWHDDINWMDGQTVLIILFLLPVMIVAAKPEKIKKPVIELLATIAVSYCGQAALNIPLFFAMGGAGVARQENVCKLWAELAFVVALYLVVTLIKSIVIKCLGDKKIFASPNEGKILLASMVSFVVIAALMLVHMKVSEKSMLQYSSYVAYVELKNGEAEDFYSTYENRMEILESEKGDVVLPKYDSKPYLLYFDDITDDSSDWRNEAFAKWYGVKSVRTE